MSKYRFYSPHELRRSMCRCYQDRKGRVWYWYDAKHHGFFEHISLDGIIRKSGADLCRVMLREVWDTPAPRNEPEDHSPCPGPNYYEPTQAKDAK